MSQNESQNCRASERRSFVLRSFPFIARRRLVMHQSFPGFQHPVVSVDDFSGASLFIGTDRGMPVYAELFAIRDGYHPFTRRINR